ncbi:MULTISPECIES: glycosyltransferase family A protein [Streptomyces]|uniref:Glycosyltransferase family 2 protein n=1 Tax=Streptomyces odorifer TaxID=53450 RepID=A0A7Y6F5S3_9ACTN|nr:glycosyltransferase family A protein [Streptomyces odorifer]NUV32375.1 glycosyltransferase family 2 protein [Streptomyces odorifer]NUV38101.1 glycosyltransferase family 2 protein [Streptomyces sp. KAI-27]NUV48763.1 glycosyltransferase family 2 protein [Streptomyces sp. CAI-78]
MAQVISVVTAVHAPAAHFLADAYASLCEQELPAGWEWEWIVQEDGRTEEVRAALPEDSRVSFEQGRAGRAAMARTMALSRVAGRYLRVLDADDLLTPGALARDINALEADPSLGWSTARVLDLLPDGSTVGFDSDPPEGVIERGAVLTHWRANEYRAQVHPATLAARADLVRALGGWMALPASEDTGLLLALNAVSRGYFSTETGLLYRKWPGQVTGHADHSEEVERAARMAVVEARAAALAELGWAFPGDPEAARFPQVPPKGAGGA